MVSGQISDRQNWTNSGHKKSWTHFGQSLDKKNRTNSGHKKSWTHFGQSLDKKILVVRREKIPGKFWTIKNQKM